MAINTALLNNNMEHLTDSEAVSAEKFHKSRLAFAWVNGQLTFNRNTDEGRDHQHWLQEDYGITVEEFESIPRGYILPGRVQLFIGSSFKEVDMSTISIEDITELLNEHNKIFAGETPSLYNGVHVGKVGEVWPPITLLGTYPN